jgi:AraC family transcriptional regulator of adaptative response/methylated-DNA-[protein]-cysteine methyltransferase
MSEIRSFTTDDQRWDAVTRRDRQADGSFLYGVKTTGVYCRPTCTSRLPKRSNVEFFATGAEARRVGYRACKKCQPEAAGSQRVPDVIVRACRLIEEAEEPPSLTELAEAVGLSPFYFHRLFKEAVGVTPRAYAAARRVERFRAGLREDQTVTRAMYGAGFASSSRCYEGSAEALGMTPGAYKNGGAGQAIRFAVARCYLGWVVVAATGRGVCLIEFGDTADRVRAEVAARFPRAELREAGAEFGEYVEQVLAFLEAPGQGLDLPLDIQGTAFQRRVWEALRAIPAGTTATYGEIAERIGQPTAVRAVARACAANRLAVAIPCHRVVRGDGELSGYRWGGGRKRELLDRERREQR